MNVLAAIELETSHILLGISALTGVIATLFKMLRLVTAKIADIYTTEIQECKEDRKRLWDRNSELETAVKELIDLLAKTQSQTCVERNCGMRSEVNIASQTQMIRRKLDKAISPMPQKDDTKHQSGGFLAKLAGLRTT